MLKQFRRRGRPRGQREAEVPRSTLPRRQQGPSGASPKATGRRDRYSVQRLRAQHGGDPKLTDLLETLANCPKARSASIHDRCKAVYSNLSLDEG
jgi:hypothetical protein